MADSEAGAVNCPICLDALHECDVEVFPCSHVFHHACAAEWTRRKPTCPVCRGPSLEAVPDLEAVLAVAELIPEERSTIRQIVQTIAAGAGQVRTSIYSGVSVHTMRR